MLNFSPVRIAAILIYFMLCSACGAPPDNPQNQGQDRTSVAGDINFLGGGSQTPDLTPEEPEYRSPTLSTPPPPSNLTWLPTIEQAVRMAERDRNIKIIIWVTSDACNECDAIERDVFTDPDVIAVSRNWFFVELDVDRNPGKADELTAGGDPPALVFLDNHGYGYDKFYGVFTADQLENMLIQGSA